MSLGFRRALAGRVLAGVGIVASVALACPDVEAFCRTTTTPIPASYNPARGCFTDGLLLFWKGACAGYSLSSAASKTVPLATATSVADAAFKTWNQVTCAGGAPVGIATSDLGPVTCEKVGYNRLATNQNVIVFHDDTWPYNDPNSTLGLTTVTFDPDTGEIYDADMELNATGGTLSTSDKVPAKGFDLLSVITHEAGHFLGLAHATSATSTMYPSYKAGTSALRTLTADDTAGLCAIYPNATTRSVSARVEPSGVLAAGACDPTPRHGFSSACAEDPPVADSGSTGGCAIGARRSSQGALLVLAALCSAAWAGRRRAMRRG
jgi:hypothetical protein